MSGGKVILISGGTGATGAALCRRFVELNHTVIGTTRQELTHNELNEKVGVTGDDERLHWIRIDLTEDKAVASLMENLEKEKLRPEIFIHCARDARYLQVDDKSQSPREGWQGTLLLDVIVPYEITLALAVMENSRLENVVLMASMYGVTPPHPEMYEGLKQIVPPVHYGVSKAAVIHLGKELAVRLARGGIRVNTVSFGGVAGRADDKFKEKYGQFCPAGRMLEKDEVAAAIQFLAMPESSGMTGHNLVVDGGWSVW